MAWLDIIFKHVLHFNSIVRMSAWRQVISFWIMNLDKDSFEDPNWVLQTPRWNWYVKDTFVML